MDLSINIQDRGKVTVDSAASFLLELIEKNLITQNGIQWISFDHYDPTINGRIGESFNPNDVDEAISIIKQNGVEFIGIGFKFTDHYHLDGKPDNSDSITKIMYSLNVASAEVAKRLEIETKIDFYMTVSFNSGLYHTEWGEEEECKFSFGGEGYIDEDNLEEVSEIISSVMKEECPDLFTLIDVIRNNFGEASLMLGFSEM